MGVSMWVLNSDRKFKTKSLSSSLQRLALDIVYKYSKLGWWVCGGKGGRGGRGRLSAP